MAERLTGKDIRNTTILKVDKDNMYIYNTTTEDGEEETVISCDAITKLGKLEDILEKYGIESLDELSNALEFAKMIGEILYKYNIQDNEELEELLDNNKHAQDVVVKQLKEIQKLQTDRDTWKRACELVCEHISTVHIITNDDMLENQDNLPQYFYQQAKKEGENK